MARKCGAKNRQGGQCGQAAGWGTDHPGFGRCKMHGGSAPNGRKAAQREQAQLAVVTYGLAREVDPHTALLEELYRTAGHVAWLGEQVAALERDKLHGPVGDALHPRQEPSVWIRLYQEERAQLARVAKTCVDVGIEERRVRVAEEQGALFAQVIRGILEDLGVADRPEVPDVLRRHLTLVSSA